MTGNMMTKQIDENIAALVARLYPEGLPRIHEVPATYRAIVRDYADQLLAAAAAFRDAVHNRPDADPEIDECERPIFEPWFAAQRVIEHYRALRDVRGAA